MTSQPYRDTLTRSTTSSLQAPARRLRITVVVDVFPALSETFVLDQVISLIEMGHKVRIIAGSSRSEQQVHEEVARYNLLDQTRYLSRLPRTRRRRLAVLVAAMRSGGVRMARSLDAFRLARRRSGEPGEMAGLAATVTALADAPRPDVILCHFGPNGSRAVRAIEALHWSVPVVTIFHGFDLSRLLRQRGPHIYDNLLHKGRLFLPACGFFADRLHAMGCPADQIMVQRMCVDLVKLDAIASTIATAKPLVAPFTFTTVGRLVPKKGFVHAIRAFAVAFSDLPPSEVRLRLVGDGPLREELESTAEELGVSGHIEFLGSLRRTDVLSAMLEGDALIQPSVTAPDGDMEGLPVVISEAMALRKPVIASRHSGIPELVVQDVTGQLVDEADETGLAEAMRWMVSNRSAAARMGLAGRKRLEGGFNAHHWNSLLEQRLLDTALEADALRSDTSGSGPLKSRRA